MEADLDRLQRINRAMRHLSELVYQDPEYEALYNDLKLRIDRNEERIFELLKHVKERKTRTRLLFFRCRLFR